MPLSPLRAPAAPTQDATQKLTSHQPAAHRHAAGLHRKSNPALLSAHGVSGFDAATRPSGLRPTPVAKGEPEQLQGTKQIRLGGAEETPRGATGVSPTAAVSPMSAGEIDAIFNKGSATYESILGSLGFKDLPQIDDPTARLQHRSDYLGQVLTADPSLKSKISRNDLMEAWSISQIFESPDFTGALNDLQRTAVQSYQNTFAMMAYGADWPPPPGGRNNN